MLTKQAMYLLTAEIIANTVDVGMIYAPNFTLQAQMVQRHIRQHIRQHIQRHIQRHIQHPLATATSALSVTTETAYLTATGVTTMTIVETTVTKRDVVCLSNIYYSAYSENGVALPMSTCMWISIVCMYPLPHYLYFMNIIRNFMLTKLLG